MAENFKATDIFVAQQFKGMKFNPYGLSSDASMLKTFPSLNNWDSIDAYMHRKNIVPNQVRGEKKEEYKQRISKIPEFKNSKDFNHIMRYIFFMYDHKSPLIKQTKVLKTRKQWAESLSDLSERIGKERAEEVVNNDDPDVVAIIIEYLIDHQPVKWTMLCSYEQQFEEFQTTLMQKTSNVKDDKDLVAAVNAKSALLEKSDKISERIVVLYQEVFTDEFAEVAKTYTRTSPEQRALKNVQRERGADI
jgi:hypothetical protein